eukprot:scaffold102363_cov20-Prasinocladus_malaysianus.AAC.1
MPSGQPNHRQYCPGFLPSLWWSVSMLLSVDPDGQHGKLDHQPRLAHRLPDPAGQRLTEQRLAGHRRGLQPGTLSIVLNE